MTTKVDERIADAVAKSLRTWRTGAGLIQREVAKRCKLTERRVSKIELADADLKPSEIEKLAALSLNDGLVLDWRSTFPNLTAAIDNQNSNGGPGETPQNRQQKAT